MKCMILSHRLISMPALGVGSQGLSFLHYITQQQCTRLSGERPEDKGRKRGKNLAGEIKISAWRWESDPFAVQFNQARWGTLLFIFLFTAPLTFLSPFPLARHSRSITFDLGQRILNSTFFYLKLPQLLTQSVLEIPKQNRDPLCICPFQWEQKSLLHSWMTNTSYCHRRAGVIDEDHHFPLDCVSQLLSSVAN